MQNILKPFRDEYMVLKSNESQRSHNGSYFWEEGAGC